MQADVTRGSYFDPNAPSSTFYYDADSEAVSSGQQLRVDWSRFENHTFFSSAAANVNVAFDRIVNGYPYDGTREQVDTFLAGLTGFERWVLSQVPTWTGHLSLSSSYVTVNDRQGGLFSGNAAIANTGASRLSPLSASLSVEMLLLPGLASPIQIIAQHAGETAGWTAYVGPHTAPQSCSFGFAVTTPAASISTTCPVDLGSFSHVCAVYDAADTLVRLRTYVNGALTSESSGTLRGMLDAQGAPLYIGSGSSFYDGTSTIVPSRTLSGSIDELRIWHAALSPSAITGSMLAPITALPGLVAYYRFNEPPPPLVSGSALSSADALVLDSSGGALHGSINAFVASCRVSSSLDGNPLVGERSDTAPVLFPEYPLTVTLRSRMLASASAYDAANPNNVLRLVPKHFLEEARTFDGANDVGPLHTGNTGNGVPGGDVLGSTQLTVSLLYTMARFFDEIKLSIDALSTVHNAFYDDVDTVPDAFLGDALSATGIQNVPQLFSDATLAQYVVGNGLASEALMPARHVRNVLLRRFLSIVPDIVTSKGTLHSVQSMLRALGVDPDASIRLRERGNTGVGALRSVTESGTSVRGLLSLGLGITLSSLALSGSRVELGWPPPRGMMVNAANEPPFGISNDPADGLWTSGSWSLGASFCWPSGSLLLTQSLMRLVSTGSSGKCASVNVLLARAPASTDCDVILYARPGFSSGSAITMLSLHNVNVLDGRIWRCGVSYKREDEATSNATSGSYELMLGNADGELLVTASFCPVTNVSSSYTTLDPAYNVSGSSVELGGSLSLQTFSGMLNDPSVEQRARITVADGNVGQLQFWSTAISDREFTAHAGSMTSYGSTDPTIRADGAARTSTGSFGRIRMDVASRLIPSERIADRFGVLELVDATPFQRNVTAINAIPLRDVGAATVANYRRISTSYDEASTSDNVRIDSFLTGTQPSHVTAPPDTRFSIELSLVDALSRAMLDSLASTDPIANAIGTSEALFSPDYPELERLSDAFYVRLVSKLDFRAYSATYRWLESIVSTIVQQLMPIRAIYNGASFVVEPHAFERGKVEYRNVGKYLDVLPPNAQRDTLLLQQIVGTIGRA
mgnify:FL=1